MKARTAASSLIPGALSTPLAVSTPAGRIAAIASATLWAVSPPARSIRPRDAIASAGHTLVELFGLARELNVDAEGIDIGPSPTDAFVAEQLGTPIEQLDMTVRSYNCL